jgi:hypothetical protein
MNKNRYLSGRVLVSAAAIKRALQDYGKAPSSNTGKVIGVDGKLVTVEHDNGERWDWGRQSLTLIEPEEKP